jgi:glycosyltransferase involved in cell wall biosynthesis
MIAAKSAMHIKFISLLGSPWGGSEELWSQAAVRLAAQGHRVSASVSYFDRPHERLTHLSAQGVRIDMRKNLMPGLAIRLQQKLGLVPRLDWNEEALKQWIVEGAPDLVCFSDGGVANRPRWRRYCAESGVPYVNVSQANNEGYWLTDDLAEAQWEALSAAQRCFFVSRGNWQLFERQVGRALANAEVVRNPFQVDYNTAPTWCGDDGPLKLACVARLEPSAKGQDLIFQVLATEKWRARDVLVSLFGSGEMERSLRRLAGMLELEDKVSFAGTTKDVAGIWRDHHALVLPSRYEGLPIAIVEAMLCHRAAIVTDVAGNAELLEDGISGFMAASPTAAAVDDAMERAWQARSKLRTMGLAAGQQVRSLVPADPVGEFAGRLISIAKEAGK